LTTLLLMICQEEKVRMQDTQGIEQQPAATAASATGRPPFRADHVGSLLRPPDLLQARDDAAGKARSHERLAPKCTSLLGHAAQGECRAFNEAG
jgi:hypothetical protein